MKYFARINSIDGFHTITDAYETKEELDKVVMKYVDPNFYIMFFSIDEYGSITQNYI